MKSQSLSMVALIFLSMMSNALSQSQGVKINDDTGSAIQLLPRIAKHSTGPSALVWMDYRNGEKPDIYMQFFGRKGHVIPGKLNIKVNDDTGTADRMSPDVAIDSKGHPIIVWADNRSGNWQIMGQAYKANADTIGGNFIINDNTSASCFSPSVAAGLKDRFIVVWSDNRDSGYDIFAQWYNSIKEPSGTNNCINTDTTGQQIFPRIDMNNQGQFVTTWIGIKNNIAHVYARVFDQNGQSLGPEVQVSQSALDQSHLSTPNVAMQNSGSFMIVWSAPDENGHLNVYGRGFDSNGQPHGDVFVVNHRYGLEDHKNPDITALVNTTFLISWQSNRLGTSDIYYKTIMLDGTTAVSENTVSGATGDQKNVAVVSDEYLNHIFVWDDTRNGNHDIYSNWLGLYLPNHAFAGSGFNGMVPISWDPPYGYTKVENYVIKRREGTSGSFTEVAHIDPSTRLLPNEMLDWIDTTVVNGKTYYYQIAMDVTEAGGISWTVNAKPSASGHYAFSKWSTVSPVIDGNIDSDEWSDAYEVDISGPNTEKSVTMYIKNSDSKLYIAIDDSNDSFIDPGNTVMLFFSTDENGKWHESGSNAGQIYFTENSATYFALTGEYPDGLSSVNLGTPEGVVHSFGTGSGHFQAEISIDLNSSPIDVSPGGGFGASIQIKDPGNFFSNPYGTTGFWPEGSLWDAVKTLGDVYLATAEDTASIKGWPMQGRTPSGNSWAEDEDILYPPFDSSRTFFFPDTNWAYGLFSCVDGKLYGTVAQSYTDPSIALKMDIETGNILWNANIINSILVCGQPAVGDSLIYYGGLWGDGVYAFRKTSGILEWIKNTGSVNLDPIIDGSRLYVIGGDSLLCLDKYTGEILWTYAKHSEGPFQSIPVLDRLNCYAENYHYPSPYLYALNKYTGTVKWKKPARLTYSIAVDDDYVYSFIEDSVIARNKTDGTGVWTYPNFELDPHNCFSKSISIDDQRLYFTTVLDPDSMARLTVLDKETGTFLWEHKFNYVSEPVIANGVVYLREYADEAADTLWGLDVNTGQTVFQDTSKYFWGIIVADHKLIAGIWRGVRIYYNASATGVSNAEIKPYTFNLSQNYPNPFNPVTTINFTLPEQAYTELAVFDVLGRRVRTIIKQNLQQGEHSVRFNGSYLPSGVYFYRIKASRFTMIKKMLLLK